MKKLEFTIEINAGKKKVWDTMLQPDSYREWVRASWPDSYYDGTWEKGEDIRFLLPGRGGTMANLVECKPHDYILAKHIATIRADGTLNRNSENSKGWIGTTESYTFIEKDGKTTLKVVVETSPDWEYMFNDGWPGALKRLKEICER